MAVTATLVAEVRSGVIRESVMVANIYAQCALSFQDSGRPYLTGMTQQQTRRMIAARWARAMHEGIVLG